MSAATTSTPPPALWRFALVGAVFGLVLLKAEVVSWFRIQEMFYFQSFHMYGTIGSAVAVYAIGRWLMGRKPVREMPQPRHLMGGTTFGLGWGLTGACPGPAYALVGFGVTPYLVVLLGILLGTWAYGVVLVRQPAAPASPIATPQT